MNLDALWHDLECAGYGEDLSLWRMFAGEAGGQVLEVGAGTGRVTLDLAARDTEMVALDVAAPLLDALAYRAAGLSVETVLADAREFALDRRFSLILVPMQTLQLMEGPSGRAAFLHRALEHLEPGGLLAAALADAMDCFDDEHDMPPPPVTREILGTRYASQPLAVVEDGGRAAIRRRRDIIGPGKRYEAHDVVVRLDRVPADQVAAEAHQLGFLNEPHRFVPENPGVPRVDRGRRPRAVTRASDRSTTNAPDVRSGRPDPAATASQSPWGSGRFGPTVGAVRPGGELVSEADASLPESPLWASASPANFQPVCAQRSQRCWSGAATPAGVTKRTFDQRICHAFSLSCLW